MRNLLLAATLLISFFLLLPQPEPLLTLPSDSFVIRNVRVFDGQTVSENQQVLVKKGQIAKIGDKVKGGVFPIIDGSGKTLLPGLIDAHTHSYGQALQEAINFGVTTELDMFSMPQLMTPMQQLRDKNNNTAQADVFSSTILATAPEGHGTEYGFKIPVLTKPSEAVTFVKERIAQGADYIKLVYDAQGAPFQFAPSISKAVLEALVKQTHEQGKIAVAHVDDLQSAKDAVNAGIDGLVHSFMDAVADDELIALMQQNHVFIVPTLSVEASLAQRLEGKALLSNPHLASYINTEQKSKLKAPFIDMGFTPEHFKTAQASVAKLNQAGINILAGTDAPNPGTAHGVSLHGELQLLVDAGLSPLQALQAATGNVNQAFDIGYRGTLKPKKPATMMLVEGDPTQAIGQINQIVAIWKHGVLFERIKAEPDSNNAQAQPGLIADFQQPELKPHWGQRLTTTVDTVVGGKSEVALSQQPEGYLKVSGEVKKGFTYPWAGLQFELGKALDFSQIKQLQFKAKGDMQSLIVMLFQKGSYQPVVQVVKLDNQWQDYTIELSGFTNADLKNVTGISWVASQTIAPFEFFIDDITLK